MKKPKANPETSPHAPRNWLVDIVVGGGLGLAIGSIVAFNFMILVGTERGYESSISEVFDYNTAAGIVAAAFFYGSPVMGVWLARRRRRSDRHYQEKDR